MRLTLIEEYQGQFLCPINRRLPVIIPEFRETK